ncbi:MAG: dethiobiotin synthase [Synergistaceae bacterium]
MAKSVFITATGTDVGKTYITSLFVKKLRDFGFKSSYYKAALSGAVRIGNLLVPGDAEFVKSVAGLDVLPKDLVSYIYEESVSPHLASKLEGNPLDLDKVQSDYNRLSSLYDYLTVEGSGGIICPLRYDDKKILLEDVIKKLDLGCVVVTDSSLGTINSTVLTVAYMKSKGIKVSGIVLNRFHSGNVMEEDNAFMIGELTNVPILSFVSENAKDLVIDRETLLSLYE